VVPCEMQTVDIIGVQFLELLTSGCEREAGCRTKEKHGQ
jgi:hypothetical protein